MRYLRSYLFFFNSPHWAADLLAATFCLLIPLVGWSLLVGYLIELAESLAKRPNGDHPAFDLNRVSDYVGRGAWPALVQVVVLLPVVLAACLALWLGTRVGPPGRGLTPMAKTIASGLPPLVFVATVTVSLVLLPVTLHLGRGAPSDGKALWHFVQDFLRQVWREALLAQTFVLVTGLTLAFFGLALCGFGVPFALTLAAFAQYHLLAQLYGLYLKRGGTALPPAAAEA